MKRAVIALVLALAALALLISLALESRSLPVETHVAQYTIAGDLERLNGDFRALVDTLQSAWQEQTPPGEGARALLERVAAQPQQLARVVVLDAGQREPGSSAQQQPRDVHHGHRRRHGARRRADRRPERLRGRGRRSCASPAPASSKRSATKASIARRRTRSSWSSERSTSPARTLRFAPASSSACSSRSAAINASTRCRATSKCC